MISLDDRDTLQPSKLGNTAFTNGGGQTLVSRERPSIVIRYLVSIEVERASLHNGYGGRNINIFTDHTQHIDNG